MESTHQLIIGLSLFGFTLAGSWRITRRFLQFFQQEEYDNRRFIKWWYAARPVEKRATAFSLTSFVLAALLPRQTLSPGWALGIMIGFGMALAALGRSNAMSPSKKALVMTSRAKRIFYVCIFYQGAMLGLGVWLNGAAGVSPLLFGLPAAVYFAAPWLLVAANLTLSPFEAMTQRRYLNEAKDILNTFRPTIIGITGSYGKTSMKHILAHILAAHAPTLATPGSVNTLMGITRIIRERLKREHRYFIVEMGAYGIGSIRSLCGLTPPQTGIVTAVGLAHYERFKSIDTVRQAKSELVQALPANGIAILQGDDPQVRRMEESTNANVFFYGRSSENGRLDCRCVEEEMTDHGARFTLEYNEKRYTVDLPLFGEHQALNATGAFLASVKLGVAPVTAIAALRTAPPIDHRLVVKRDATGIVTIDDAYNSNPIGFQCALRVLDRLTGSRKILVTPGMVELGEAADEKHREIARLAASVCTFILVIAGHRFPAFKDELKQRRFPDERIVECQTLGEARGWLNRELRPGDVVLFENDLPDLYEAKSAFRLF